MKQEMGAPPRQADDDQRPGKRTPIHHDSPYLPRRGDLARAVTGCQAVCERECSLCRGVVKSTLLIAVIMDFALPAERERK